MSKTLVFGAGGRVGSILTEYLEKFGKDVLACRHADCDLCNLAAVKDVILSSGATHVINCAAVSGIEACLDDPVTAHYVNAMAPELMARLCRQEGMRFNHLLTAYELDGPRPG